jgi:anthranilate phosphoribosyltransferase
VRAILDGWDAPAARVVLANAAAALLAAERVATPREGVAVAAETLACGKARKVLERLVACSQSAAR